MLTALYIGRFQPFHKGHLDVVQHIESSLDIEKIIIAIGSSQYNYLNKSPTAKWTSNPFTFEERREMIQKSIDGVIKKPVEIVALSDLHNYKKWFANIDETIEFDVLYTSNRGERECFESHDYEVRGFPKYYDFRATDVRHNMGTGKPYKYALPFGTIEVVDRIRGEERIKELMMMDIALKIKCGGN